MENVALRRESFRKITSEWKKTELQIETLFNENKSPGQPARIRLQPVPFRCLSSARHQRRADLGSDPAVTVRGVARDIPPPSKPLSPRL